MERVYLILCEDEYDFSVQMVCSTKKVADKLCALMNEAAKDERLCEDFYGEYRVEEFNVAETVTDASSAWTLRELFSIKAIPDEWKDRLSVFDSDE